PVVGGKIEAVQSRLHCTVGSLAASARGKQRLRGEMRKVLVIQNPNARFLFIHAPLLDKRSRMLINRLWCGCLIRWGLQKGAGRDGYPRSGKPKHLGQYNAAQIGLTLRLDQPSPRFSQFCIRTRGVSAGPQMSIYERMY